MSVILIYILAALLPALFLLSYIYKNDTIEKEPGPLLWKLFFLGVLAAIPACLLEYFGEGILGKYISSDSPIYSIVLAYLIVAVAEEGMKFLFLRLSVWNDPNFNYRFDGVVYAVFVSLGFAAIENILYVFSYGLTVAVPRALLAVPAHMGFAVFMGTFLGSAQLRRAQGRNGAMRANLIAAYLVPVFLHGTYDSCAMINTGYSAGVFFAFVAVMYVVVINLVKKDSRTDTEI